MTTAPEHVHIPSRDGLPLAALVLPPGTGPGVGTAPGVVVLHGYGSRKENHLDFAGRLAAAGMWAVVPDLRGHGETGGDMDEGMIGDVLACLDHLKASGCGPLGLRGSSMGGFLALVAAPRHPGVRAVVSICPARPEPLARRLDHPWPICHSLEEATVRADGVARGFWHAHGDEVVPWQNTFMLASRAAQPKHLRIEMGGNHRSLQHDPRIQEETALFLADHLGAETRAPR
jgi:dienelactone hydrolase